MALRNLDEDKFLADGIFGTGLERMEAKQQDLGISAC
jgi:hypothetical protein